MARFNPSLEEREAARLKRIAERDIPKPKILTVDEYYAQRKPSNALVEHWITVGSFCRRIVTHHVFEAFMNTVIVFAGALVGLQTYSSMENSALISTFDSCILVTFVTECLLNIFSDPLRPWKYWIGPDWGWNNFDFLIVVSCIVLPGSSGAVLRLLRLLRVVELLRANSQMRMIIGGLIAGMRSAVFVLVLLFLVFYMYAAFGVMFFAEQDPWHFGSMLVAFVTLYRVATLDGWGEIAYINYYGCDVYPGTSHYGGYITQAKLLEQNRTLGKGEKICTPEAFPVTSLVYFQTFIVLCTLIFMSLFIGIMTIAMIGIIHDMAGEERQKSREKEAAQKQQVFKKLYAGSRRDRPQHQLLLKDRQRVFKISKALAVAIGGDLDTKFRTHEASLMSGTCCAYYVHFAILCRTIAYSDWFSAFIGFVIIFAGVEVGLQSDNLIPKVAATEWIVSGLFILEALMKIIGEMSTPWHYFEDAWNRFDFFVICINFAIMRLARLMRVLKLLRIIPKLQLIVTTILNSFSSIVYIGAILGLVYILSIALYSHTVLMHCTHILGLVYYLFGTAGVILFGDNDPWHFGTHNILLSSPLSPLFSHYSPTILPLFSHYSPTILSPFSHHSPTILPLFSHYSPTILALFSHYSLTIVSPRPSPQVTSISP
jgi:voltage-gated sodium channel